jgi:hypothetical protein
MNYVLLPVHLNFDKVETSLVGRREYFRYHKQWKGLARFEKNVIIRQQQIEPS